MFTIIKQLKGKIIANKSFLIKIAVFLWIYLLFSELSFATQSWSDVSQTSQSTFDKAKNTVAEVTVWISTMVSLLLWLMTYLVTMFLSPEWTNGSLFGMNSKFKEIWIFVSNFVYLAFAFILIAIAFMNIIWKWEWNFAFKQAIPRFILWILIVPFSWFLVNFLVSLSSILFVWAMNLPSDIFTDYNKNLDKITVPKNCTIDLKNLTDNTKKDDGKEVPKSIYDCWEKDEKWNYKETVSLKDVLWQWDASSWVFWIMSTYTYGILNLNEFDELNTQKILDWNLNTIWDIVVHVVFNLLFIVVYALLMIALGLAVMIRWIWLWIYIMLSPLMGLMIFFWKAPGWKFFEKFNFSEFIALAMVPVYSMLALSFWLLFIFVVNDWLNENKWWQFQDSTVKINKVNNQSQWVNGQPQGNSNQTKLEIWWWKDGNKFTLTIDWAISENAKGKWKNVLWSWLWIIWNLILKIFGIVILWWTVMAALKSSKITEEIITPIANFGEWIWKAVSSLPQYTPILPGGQSLKSLESIPRLFENKLNDDLSKQTDKASKFLWIEKTLLTKLKEEISWSDLNKNSTNDDKAKNLDKILMKWIEQYWSLNEALKRNDFQEAMDLYNTRTGLELKLDYNNLDNFRKSINDKFKNFTNLDGQYSALKTDENFREKYMSSKDTSSQENKSNTQNTNQTNNQNVININLANRQIALPTAWNWTSYQVSDAWSIANTIKSSLWVDNNWNKVTITENEIKSALNWKGISDDIINQVIASLRTDWRITNPTSSNPRQ